MLRQYLPILIFLGLATVLGLALFTVVGYWGRAGPMPKNCLPMSAALRLSKIRACASTSATTWSPSFSSCSIWRSRFLSLGGFAQDHRTFGLLSMLIFRVGAGVALAYDYKKGALEWD